MPKTATGKVQRRLVAKAMIDKEKADEEDMKKKVALKEKAMSGETLTETSTELPFLFAIWKKLFLGLWRLFF
jgi:hypothetical protein